MIHIYYKQNKWGCPYSKAKEREGYTIIDITLSPYYKKLYQLAFFTPGMRPADAISRNWIREMPN
jgi:hypothetical protein